MQKNIEIKVYNVDGTFKETLKSRDNISDFRYTWAINEGQGGASFELNRPFNDTGISHGDMFRVYLFSEQFTDGLLIYTGVINRIERVFSRGIETVTVSALGLSALLNQIYFKAGALYIHAVNEDPATTIKAIVDYFNTVYTAGWLTYAGGCVQNYGSSMQNSFSYDRCGDAIKKIASLTDYFFRIDPSGEVCFQPKSSNPIHNFTVGKDVEEIRTIEDGEKITNKYLLEWSGGTNNDSDATSISDFGLRELFEDKSGDIGGSGSADIAIDNFLVKNANPKLKTTLVVNQNYGTIRSGVWDDTRIWDDNDIWYDLGGATIENIAPGDTVRVRNFEYDISNLQIAKIDYNFERVKIELEDFDTLAKEIFS